MNREPLAAIDIGSNAIRLLISYMEQNGDLNFKKATFIRIPIRLGEDVFTKGYIGKDKQKKLYEAMLSFFHLMRIFNVKKYRACATSAMRESKNNHEIVEYIQLNCGLTIDIISGKEEAEIIFEAGNITGLMDANHNYLYVDVGGGSTEITIYANHKRILSESFPIGTVRMISNGVTADEFKKFKSWLRKNALPLKPTAIIGSGGNINKIHKLLGRREKESLHYVEMKLLHEQLGGMNYEQRIQKFHLNAYRADVIIPALKIFLTVAKNCSIDEIIVPRIGLVDGIIHQLGKAVLQSLATNELLPCIKLKA